MTDVIILGEGLAACVCMHAFYNQGISFKVIASPDKSNCSRVAAGIWNPLVFKRMTESWQAETLIPEMKAFYKQAESRMGVRLLYEWPIVRALVSSQSRDQWNQKSVNALSHWICSAQQEADPLWKHTAAFACRGIIKEAGYLDVRSFILNSIRFFSDWYHNEILDFNELMVTDSGVVYKHLNARHIVFCDGYRVHQNPFFNWVPMKPVQGELLEVSCENLSFTNQILNYEGFIIPRGSDRFTLGATYDWTLPEGPTQKGRMELVTKWQRMVSLPFQILSQASGIRPSSPDRRPVVGLHPQFKSLIMCNGLGAKGVMLAPYVAGQITALLKHQKPLPQSMDLSRFYPHFSQS